MPASIRGAEGPANPSALIGIVASILLLGVVTLWSAEDPRLFIGLPGLGIVVLGTRAATFISYPGARCCARWPPPTPGHWLTTPAPRAARNTGASNWC
ncbi:MAG: hypothetical protein ACOVKS_09805 [Aquimonas sp.]